MILEIKMLYSTIKKLSLLHELSYEFWNFALAEGFYHLLWDFSAADTILDSNLSLGTANTSITFSSKIKSVFSSNYSDRYLGFLF